MNSHEPLVFTDLSPIEIPATIGDKSYVLREATGNVACRYRNALLACTQLGPEGKPSKITGMADVEPLLVSLCMFEDGTKPVPQATVRAWPNRIVKSLFDRVKEISDLDEDDSLEGLKKERQTLDERIAKLEAAEDKAKNSPSNTTDGSG